MNMSEKDLEELLKRNPALKVKGTKKRSGVPHPLDLPPRNSPEELINPEEKKKPKNKYKNIKLYEYENGMVSESKKEENCGKIIYTFDSIKEYERWKELQMLEKSGEISDLQRQCHLLIQEGFSYRGNRIRKIEYVADFMYKKSDEVVVEDVKPFDKRKEKYRLTKDFSLKWKLLKYKYPEHLFVIY